MFTIKTPNPKYNDETYGVKFENGLAKVKDVNTKNILVNDFGYELVKTEKPKKEQPKKEKVEKPETPAVPQQSAEEREKSAKDVKPVETKAKEKGE